MSAKKRGTGTGQTKRKAASELALRDYRLLAEFRFFLARFLAFSETAAKAKGLAPRQHQALLAIKGAAAAAVTVGDLAERLCIRHHSAVGLVDRLVASGHVLRKADAIDRRRMNLSLTLKGEKVLAALSTAHRQELRRITPVLKPLLAHLEGSGAREP